MHQYAPVKLDHTTVDETGDVLIINYNGENNLKESIPVWKQRKEEGYVGEIIIFDNDSNDESIAMVEESFPDVRIIANDQNIGFTGAVNAGIQSASSKFVFISTPDMIVTQSWCHRLLSELASDDNIGAATGIILRPSGKVDGRGAIRDSWFRFSPASPSDTVNPVDTGRGSGLIVDTDAFKEAGGIDEDLFIQWDEISLTLNLCEAGYRTVFIPGTLAWHCENLGGTDQEYYSARNLYILSGRHTKNLDFLLIVVGNGFRDFIRTPVLALLGLYDTDIAQKRLKGAARGMWTMIREKVF